MSMVLNIQRYLQHLRKYWLIGQAVLLLIVVRMMISRVRLPSMLECLDVINISNVKKMDSLTEVSYYTDRLLSIYPVNERGNCLPRSLVLYVFAKRFGFPVQFHCGVQWVQHELIGHAWLTLDGEAFCEPTRQWEHFDVTYSFPQSSPSNHSDQTKMSRRAKVTSCVS